MMVCLMLWFDVSFMFDYLVLLCLYCWMFGEFMIVWADLWCLYLVWFYACLLLVLL